MDSTITNAREWCRKTKIHLKIAGMVWSGFGNGVVGLVLFLRFDYFSKPPPTRVPLKVSGHVTYRFILVFHALSRSGGTGVFPQSHRNLLGVKVQKDSQNHAFSSKPPKSVHIATFFRRVATELHRSHRILICIDRVYNARITGPVRIAHRPVLEKSINFQDSV